MKPNIEELRKKYMENPPCKCQYKNAQKVENKNVHFPRAIPQLELP